MRKRILILMLLALAVAASMTVIPEVKADNVRGSVILYPTDDASVWMQYPSNNYGASDHVGVRNRYGHPSHPDYWEVNALIKFDLSSISPGAVIVSATLYLYYYDCVFNNCQNRDLTCYRITSGWDEGSVTWDTRPGYAAEVTSYSIVPSTWGWMDWDVAGDVQDFVDGQEANYGWQIMDTTTWREFSIPDSRFRTKEYGGQIPYLEISFYGCQVFPTSLDFGTVVLGNHLDKTFTITNRGEETLSGSVGESCDHYSIVSGGGAYSLEPGDSVTVTVRFEPISAGQHDCTVETGNDACSDVFCTGVGESFCQVSPVTLDFGVVRVGDYLDKTFTIANTGEGTLIGSVAESCDHYSVVSGGGAYSLGPGEWVTVTVRFEPVSAGQHHCTIETGDALCSDVPCTGTGDSWDWKPPCEDYAPSGMPDVDQKQDDWKKEYADQWSFCGPCAVANCFWWFDSKYNVPPGFPGDGEDQFPLVRDYMDNLPPWNPGEIWDDHDPWNLDHAATPWPVFGIPPSTSRPFVAGPQPQPSGMPAWGELVERLAWYLDTDGIRTEYCQHTGTNLLQMQEGIHMWLQGETFSDGSTLADSLCGVAIAKPTFAFVESLVQKSENVILLLGFWYRGETLKQQAQAFLRGDFNQDGRIDAADATLCITGGPFLCDDAADANDDGALSMVDCAYLTSYLFYGGPPPPAPFPACGTDPTADELDCATFPFCDWWRVGGHYVTAAGVNSEEQMIAFSDPFVDAAEMGIAQGRVGDGVLIEHLHGDHDPAVHNDEGNVSHDMYHIEESPNPGGVWGPADYPVYMDPYLWMENFFDQNVPDEFLAVTEPWNESSPIYTQVEYAVRICPGEYRGDCNDDGVVNVGDVVYLINYLYKGDPPPDPYSEGDLNCDDIINVGDVVRLINYLYRNWPAPGCCNP